MTFCIIRILQNTAFLTQWRDIRGKNIDSWYRVLKQLRTTVTYIKKNRIDLQRRMTDIPFLYMQAYTYILEVHVYASIFMQVNNYAIQVNDKDIWGYGLIGMIGVIIA